MIGFIQILLLSLSLSMDAFSVAVAGGIKSQNAKINAAFKVALYFGLFQAVMPILGWLLGSSAKDLISGIDHWVAFILLSIIGIKMIREAVDHKSAKNTDILNTKHLLSLSVATSIDAFIIGITLNLVKTPVYLSVLIIGVTTFIVSLLGFSFGKKLGLVFGKRMEILGGICLIIIGLAILIEHLTS